MTDLSPQNVEGAVVGILGAAVAVDVGTRVPNPRPESFVRVQRIGGAQLNMIQERPLVLIECWAGTTLAAWQLASAAYEALQGRDPLEYNGFELEQRAVSSPVNYPDPSTTSPRYQFQLETTVNLKGASS